MRILYLSDSSIPSASANSVHVMKMCSAFVANGHDVSLYCYANGGLREAFGYYGLEPSFRLCALRNVRLPAARRALRALEVYRTASGSARPDLAYGRDLYGLLVLAGSGMPLVFEAHTPPRSRLDALLLGWLIRRENFIRLVVISGALRDELLSRYPRLEPWRVRVAHDAADACAGAEVGTVPWKGRSGVLQIGYVGSLLPGKGGDMVVKLAGELPQYDFHVVGGDPASVARLRGSSSACNLFLHGHVEHALVERYLAHFDVALFPMQRQVLLADGTDIARWTSPLKLFEYMGAGKPIVGSDLDVVKEVLTDGVDAMLVPAADLVAWRTAINRLAEDAALRAAIGAAAQRKLLRSHTWTARARAAIADLPEPRRDRLG